MRRGGGHSNRLDNVTLLEQTEDKMFAIMLGDKNGVYSESNSNGWPTDGTYIFNSNKSGCIDIKGNTVDNVLSFDNNTYLATINTNTTIYCYLYFDIETEPPIGTISINSGANYTTSEDVTLTLSVDDANQMCISNTEECINWIDYSNSISHTLTTGDGTKIVYVLFKDRAGNISTQITDTIILDTQVPVVNASAGNLGIINITLTETTSGVKRYCVNTEQTNTTGCNWISTNNTTITNTQTVSGTYYVHVEDNAGNTGHSNSVTIQLGLTGRDFIKENLGTGGLGITAYNGMYRYTGTNVNNYVSLDGVLYRIIGITSTANSTLGLEAGQYKLIKATSIGTYNWHNNYTINATWNTGGTNAAMYTYLNGAVLYNTSYIPSGWSSRIDSVKWYVGDVNETSNEYVGTGTAVAGYEDNTITSGTSKMGLMYMSDYYFSNATNGETTCYYNCSTWMTLGEEEWTMTRYGYYFEDYYVWYVGQSSAVSYWFLNNTNAVRPVFYLNPDVVITGGTGQESDPYIMS